MNDNAILPGFDKLVKPFKFAATPHEFKVTALRECPTPDALQICDTPDKVAEYWRLHITGHGHFTAVSFSPDGRRLLTTSRGLEIVKLWDVSTRQELLTLSGTGSFLQGARWSADGDVILVGAPWQIWRAPSLEEITAAEAAGEWKEEKEL